MASKRVGVEAYAMYLKFAKDMEDVEPAVALCCKMHYLDKYIETKKQQGLNAEDKVFVQQLMKSIEDEKDVLGLNKDERYAMLLNFCQKIFISINQEEEKAEKVTKLHAMQFHTTANFIELLAVFGPIPPDWEEKSMLVYFNNVGREVLQV